VALANRSPNTASLTDAYLTLRVSSGAENATVEPVEKTLELRWRE
jgi:hypothetical protein